MLKKYICKYDLNEGTLHVYSHFACLYVVIMVDYILELQRECFAFFPQKSTNLS